MKHSDVTNEIWVDVADSGFVASSLQMVVKDLSGINPITMKMNFSVEEAENLANSILQKVKAFKDEDVKGQLLTDILEDFDLEGEFSKGRNWIAVDSNGEVCSYNEKPRPSIANPDMWSNNGESPYSYLGSIRCSAHYSEKIGVLWKHTVLNIPEILCHDKTSLKSDYQNEEFVKCVLSSVDLEKEFFKGKNYIAVDSNGQIYSYKCKPRILNNVPFVWTASDDSCICIGRVESNQCKDFKNLWRVTLIEIYEYMQKEEYCKDKESTYQLFGLPFKLNVKKAISEGFTHLAVDRSGALYIYKGKPSFSCTQWKVSSDIKYKKLHKFHPNQVLELWRGSCVSLQDLLERRCYRV